MGGRGNIAGRRGVSLLELLIVMAIIGIMVSMLLPAVQFMRQQSLRVACDNNIRQIDLAIQQYSDVHQRYFPLPPAEGRVGGWAVAILPFIEEGNLYELLDTHLPLIGTNNQKVAMGGPALFVCPNLPPVESSVGGVPGAGYLLLVDPMLKNVPQRKRYRRIIHTPPDSHIPWCASPELDAFDYPDPPHSSAFGF